MPTLEPIGRVNPDELDLEPLTIPIVGYREDKSEVITEVRFQPVAPLGYAMDMLRAVDNEGNISQNSAILYIDACVYPADKEKWDGLLNQPGVYISGETIAEVYRVIGEFYTNRPTKRRSASSSGRSRTQPTSRAAASSPKSTAKASR